MDEGFLCNKRYLILDRDAKYSLDFCSFLARNGLNVIRLPPRSPNLNAFAERFVRSIKSECLNRMIFFGQASLQHAIVHLMAHYHHERNHQGIGNRPLQSTAGINPRSGPVRRRRRLPRDAQFLSQCGHPLIKAHATAGFWDNTASLRSEEPLVPVSNTVFLFSGQGSQYFQMGKELFEQNGVFRDSMYRLDQIVRDLSGQSVIEAVYSPDSRKTDPFDRTLLTHPAILMVEYSLAQCLIVAGIVPNAVLGSSLGSFAAAAVAGCMAIEDAVAAVVQQAAAFESRCDAGGMLAVFAEPSLFEQAFLREHSELAGVNFSSHFVISAPQHHFEPIEAGLRNRNIAFQRLPVSFAFHSKWIDAARVPIETFLQSIQTKSSRLPLVCCERAGILTDPPDGAYFWRLVRGQIRFRETIAQLEREAPRRYIDVGPAGTLATFLKYGLPPSSTSTVHPLLTPFGQDRKNLAALI